MFIKLFAITALLLFSLPLLADTLYIYDSRESGYSQKVGEAFRAKGFAVETVGSDDLKNLSGSGRDVLAVIGSDRFPAEANKAFGEFIKNGNGWFGIGGLPFSAPTYALDGSYLTEEELKKAAAERATHTAVSFNRETCSSFKISDSEGIGDARLSSEETEEGNALHISAPAVRSWEQYALKSLPDGAFSDGSMLVFRAKGDADTKEVWLGFHEADGSRWYRRLPLTEEYTEFMLEAGHFRFWNDPPVKGRGEEGDSLKFSNIKEMEMAFMTSAPVTGTPQNVYITDIRTAPAFDPVGFGALPVMEAVYPHNMMWSTDAVTAVKAADGTEAACSETVYTPLWRNQGFGQKYAGKYRQIPLAFCYEGESLRGIAAQVLINYEESEAPGSAWAYIGNSPGFLEKNPGYAETLLSKIASLFAGEARLVNAGTSAFSYLPGEKVKAGFTAVAGAASKNRVSVAVRDGAGNLIREQTKTVSFKPGKKVSAGISAAGLAPGLYETETVLYSAEGGVQDRLLQKFSVFDENSRNESNVVAARDGNFWVDGRIWVPWGINYWPLYSSGRESSDYFGITWLFPEQYNPTLIEQDMALLKSINANCISIQYTKEPEADALRDLLERLKQFDIKVL
ncbi:MAG: hypothetical protein ILO36_02270, partial [Abditibacteriota bacterium]|nr:hypothetical protein [Abditibacteriota bacterium]